jgi:hypothetical protein
MKSIMEMCMYIGFRIADYKNYLTSIILIGYRDTGKPRNRCKDQF